MSLGFNPDDIVNNVLQPEKGTSRFLSQHGSDHILMHAKSEENQIVLGLESLTGEAEIPLMRLRVGTLMQEEEESTSHLGTPTLPLQTTSLLDKQSIASSERMDRYKHNLSLDSNTFDQYFKNQNSNLPKSNGSNPFLKLGNTDQRSVQRVASVRRQETSVMMKYDDSISIDPNLKGYTRDLAKPEQKLKLKHSPVPSPRKKGDKKNENGLTKRWIQNYGELIPDTQPVVDNTDISVEPPVVASGPMKRYIVRKNTLFQRHTEENEEDNEHGVYFDDEDIKMQLLEVKDQQQEQGIQYDVLHGAESDENVRIDIPLNSSADEIERLCAERQEKYAQKTLDAMPTYEWPRSRGRGKRVVNQHTSLVATNISATQFTNSDIVVHNAPMHGLSIENEPDTQNAMSSLHMLRERVSTLISRSSPVKKSGLVGSGEFVPSLDTIGRHHGKQEFVNLPIEKTMLCLPVEKYKQQKTIAEVGVRVDAVVTASEEHYSSAHFWVLAEMQKKQAFFAPLPVPVICVLLTRAHVSTIPKGTIACPLTPAAGDVYIVLQGRLGLNQDTIETGTIGPGHCVGTLLYNDKGKHYDASIGLDMVINTTMYLALEDTVQLHQTPGQYQHIIEQGLATHLAATLTALSHIPELDATPAILLHLARNSIPYNQPPHKVILMQNATRIESGMYLLLEGCVIVARRTQLYVCQCRRSCTNKPCTNKKPKSIVVQVNKLFAPCLIGELSLLTNTNREAHVYTDTNSIVVRIPRAVVYEQQSSAARQKLVNHAKNSHKYSSENLVQQILRKQETWDRLKQKLLSALILTKNTIR